MGGGAGGGEESSLDGEVTKIADAPDILAGYPPVIFSRAILTLTDVLHTRTPTPAMLRGEGCSLRGPSIAS